MNIRIYSPWKKLTNIWMNEYIRQNIFEYLNICPTLTCHLSHTISLAFPTFLEILDKTALMLKPLEEITTEPKKPREPKNPFIFQNQTFSQNL